MVWYLEEMCVASIYSTAIVDSLEKKMGFDIKSSFLEEQRYFLFGMEGQKISLDNS